MPRVQHVRGKKSYPAFVKQVQNGVELQMIKKQCNAHLIRNVQPVKEKAM